MKLENRTIIILIILTVISVVSSAYGIYSHYSFSDDLPILISSVNNFDSFHYDSSPFFIDGSPDIHSSYYSLILSVLKSTTLFNSGIVQNIFNSSIFDSVFILYVIGIILSIFLPLSFYIMSRTILKKNRAALIATIIFILLSEIPLIRWAGITSFHGLLNGSFFPQTFAYVILFVLITFFIKFKNSSYEKFSISGLILILILEGLLILSHLFTGLIGLFIILFMLSYEYFKSKKLIFIFCYLFFIVYNYLLIHFWPFFPIESFIQITIPYYLIMALLILVIPFSFLLLTFQKKYTQNENNPTFYKLLNLSIVIGFILFIFTLSQFKTNLPEYPYSAQINYWLYPFFMLTLSGIILSIPLLLSRLDTDISAMVVFFIGTIIIYFMGLFNILSIKVFWRFLLISRIPSILILSFFISKYLYHPKFKKLVTLIIFVIVISSTLTISSVLDSDTANYFKDTPYFYSINIPLQERMSDSLILTDPTTSYYIATLTNNKVMAVMRDRVSDYDLALNEIGLKRVYSIFTAKNNLNCSNISVFKGIVINKNLNINSDLETFRVYNNNFKEVQDSFENCGFILTYQDSNFIILQKNETS